MICNCDDFKKNIKILNSCIENSMIHDLGYDGRFFKYCPWCGSKLYDDDINAWCGSGEDKQGDPAY